MGQDFVIVNDIALSYVIREELERLGIQPEYTAVTSFRKFTKEELASIKELKLENNMVTDISVLKYCTSLKKLIIRSQNSKQVHTNFTNDSLFSYKMKRASIQDFAVISRLKSLEYLEIQDDDTLTSLDLTGLDRLTSLKLVGNHKLTEIKGLEKLKGLSELKMVNNAIESSFDLKTMLDNGLYQIDLDFDLYPMIKANFPNIRNELLKLSNYGIKCNWSENLSDIRFNTVSTLRVDEMDLKAKEILDSIIAPDYSDIEKIAAIYAYIIQNVTYDYDSLNAAKKGEDNNSLRKANEDLSELTSTILDRRQSSFNAILEGKAVCEGYANMMHYLLKSIGINSMTVHCNSDLNTIVVGSNSTHIVIKLELNGETYYFDPTWDAQKNLLSNFLKTKEEFSINHVLSMSENDIISPTQKPFTNEQLSQIFNKVIADRNTGRNHIKNTLNEIEIASQSNTSGQYLSEYDQELKYLQEEYGLVATKIEKLMQRNSQSPVENYQQQLEDLIAQRDMINEEILLEMKSHRI